MDWLNALKIAGGITSSLGGICFLAVLYFNNVAKREKESLAGIIGHTQLRTEDVVTILKEFKEDATRLKALERLLSGQQEQAGQLLEKLNTSKFDLEKFVKHQDRSSQHRLKNTGNIVVKAGLLMLVAGFTPNLISSISGGFTKPVHRITASIRRVELDERGATIATTNLLTTDHIDISDGEVDAIARWVEMVVAKNANYGGEVMNYQMDYVPKFVNSTITNMVKIKVGFAGTVTVPQKKTVPKFIGPDGFSFSPHDGQVHVYFFFLDTKTGHKIDDVEVTKDGIALLPASGKVVVQFARSGYEPKLMLMALDKELKQQPIKMNPGEIRVALRMEGGDQSITTRIEGAIATKMNLKLAPSDAFEILTNEINNKSVALNTAVAVETLGTKLTRVRMDYEVQIQINNKKE